MQLLTNYQFMYELKMNIRNTLLFKKEIYT